MNRQKIFALNFAVIAMLTSCSSTVTEPVVHKKSYLAHKNVEVSFDGVKVNQQGISEQGNELLGGIENVPALNVDGQDIKQDEDLSVLFSNSKMVAVSAEELLLKDYIHHVFGELLQVNYILGQGIQADKTPVSINVHKPVSQKRLYALSEKVLEERQYVIKFQDGIYYIHKSQSGEAIGNVMYGYGNKQSDVPNTSANIVQLVPFTFGMQTSLANTLKKVVNVTATPDFDRNAIILQGKRKDILKALDFIQLMDQPKLKNRVIAIYQGQYVSTEEIIKSLPPLLAQEGISVDVSGQADKAISLVPLERIGSIVLFANNQAIIDRVVFWANKLDQPPTGDASQYFIYTPKFARATDLGQSIQPLIGGVSSAVKPVSTRTSATNESRRTTPTNSATNSAATTSAFTSDMRMVVDERANAIIFFTTGNNYQHLLPLIKRLDVMPKQVLLEVMIAEVKLTDNYKSGIELLLTNQGLAKVGGFTLSNAGSGLSYVLSGTQGKVDITLQQNNENINILSRPSLLVRDGVSASITVGDDIPTVGEIVSQNDSDRQSVVYRKTGVDLKVKPTINARGVVIMEISQQTSDQSGGSSAVQGNPIIFERSIVTEVVAGNGQTIVLGGLISEKNTLGDTSVPFFSSIPVVGALFDSVNEEKIKTELVVLLTPRIIESTDEWDDIKAKFAAGLTQLKLN
ncbi:hypothetical protein [Thalassotalea fusca]